LGDPHAFQPSEVSEDTNLGQMKYHLG